VKTLTELRDGLREKADQKTASLAILRKGATINVSVAIEKPHQTESIQMFRRAQL